ncbi:MAG: hypothetical protein IJC17_07740 [Clostridia bacterium]|nr:hypothetical protein [Clostridia bacterium]
MKPRKIRRRSTGYRRSAFRRRTPILKIVGTVAALAVVVTAGFFAGKLLFGDSTPEVNGPTPSSTTTTTTVPSGSSSATTTTAPQTNGALSLSSVKAVVLSTDALKNTETLKTTLQAAKKAGFTGIVFDMKDAKGNVWFAADGALAKEAQAVVEKPLTETEFKAVLALCQTEKMLAIPRMYGFLDATASKKLVSARIAISGSPTIDWLDDYAENGGKPWLNPYSPQAHSYLIELAKQLHEWGCTAMIFDGVQFPNRLDSLADFGKSAYTSMSKLEVLQTFVKSLTDALAGCEISVCANGAATIGENTAAYGGNPLSFGSRYVSPLLYPETLGSSLTVGTQTVTDPTGQPAAAVAAAYRLVNDRVKLLNNAAPKLLPWLTADGATAAQVKEEIAALGGAPFVLYTENGTYDFTALQP